MKRLLIYFFYDKEGIVDDYVYYFLERMRRFSEHICFVVNGYLSLKDKYKLEGYVEDLLIRENFGMDAYAYKYAINYFGFEKLAQYDEVIFTNYTFFGPIFPISNIFDKMDTIKCDWWGLHKWFMEAPIRYNHIPSSFVVYRKKLLISTDFMEYWNTLPEINSYEEAVAYHEQRQTPYYDKLGYISAVYLEDTENKLYTDTYWPLKMADELLIKKHFPLLKRRVFFSNNKNLLYPKAASNCLAYLKNFQFYDYNLIKNNLLRTQTYHNISPTSFKHFIYKIKSKYIKDKNNKYISKCSYINYVKTFLKYLDIKQEKYFDKLKGLFYKKYIKNNKEIIKILFIKFKTEKNIPHQYPLHKPTTISLGKYTYSGSDIFIANPHATYIGKFTSIGNRVRLGHGEHPINYLTTSPYLYFDELGFKSQNMTSHPEFWRISPIVIGHDVWIGDNVFIKNGIHIGNGAIIAAGAVVTKNVAPYSIVGGVPAKVLKYRHPQEIIDKLLKLEWWYLPDEIIKKIPYDNIEKAIEYIQNINNKINQT